jgi:hypothetical protein
MRPPVDTIVAPRFPKDLGWVNVAGLRMEQQATRPVLVAFWDVCHPSSLRTLPYLSAWDARYAEAGLRVIGVHASAFDAGNDEALARAAIERLGLAFAIALDPGFELWRAYANPGWPARYLFAPRLRLADVHHGEGAYAETEAVIRELLGLEAGDPVPLADPADDDDAPLVVPSADVDGPYAGPYTAGEVWVVVDRPGEVLVDGETVALDRVGAHRVRRHERSEQGEVAIAESGGARVLRTAFLPGLAG